MRLAVSLLVVVAVISEAPECAPDSPHAKALVPGPLPFCEEYQSLSCCTAEEAGKIRDTVGQLIGEECTSCYSMIRDWKCGECHPGAGAFHKGQFSQIRFCKDYCRAIFEVCSDIPLDLRAGAEHPVFYLNGLGETAEEWCKGKVSRDPNCFTADIPESHDTNCKCRSQTCHLDEEMLEVWDDEEDLE